MTLSPEQIRNALEQPELAAHLADLVYIQDQHLTIHRKKHGRGYSYLLDNKTRLTDKAQLKRIKELVIPPGWQKVRISAVPNGHLQCVGRDEKNRKVYRYHDFWSLLRNQTKFFKMAAFAKVLPKIRKRVVADLELEGMPLDKCLAIVLTIMDKTAIRVGNQQYATRNGTYGLSTLRTKHINHENDGLIFEFKGKKGVQQSKSIEDDDLIALINECEEIPGYELFQYFDEQGKKHAVDSGLINEYIHEVAGDIFSAKDFRTWRATCSFFDTIVQLPPTDEQKERHANVLTGYHTAATALGNTSTVVREYYIHPQVVSVYEDGNFEPYYKKATSYKPKNSLDSTERCVQEIVDDFEITFALEK
jgi:DNA topoisomerase-1